MHSHFCGLGNDDKKLSSKLGVRDFFSLFQLSGNCGLSQPGTDALLFTCQNLNICESTNTTEASIAHSLCNDYYNSAFENDFVANNAKKCSGTVSLDTLPFGYKMGYMETRQRFGNLSNSKIELILKFNFICSRVRGIIPCPTVATYPHNVVSVWNYANFFF
jgi:hypothetical protein